MSGLSPVELDHFVVLFMALVAISVTSGLAWMQGYYTLPPQEKAPPREVKIWHVLFAFLLFILIQTTIVPGVYLWVESWLRNESWDLVKFEMGFVTEAWLNLIGVVVIGASLYAFLFTRSRALIRQVFNSSRQSRILLYFNGCASWLIVYPIVVAVGQIIALIVAIYYHGPTKEQVAVRNLVDMVKYPDLMWATIVAIITIIPFVEELLFRGFLQEWLRQYANRVTAIVITSLVFTLFHYSHSQGMENIQLLVSLFILACFLGFLKEKYRALWTTVGLHATFNFVSILLLLM